MKTRKNIGKIEVLKPTNALMRGKKGVIPIFGVIGAVVVVCAAIYGGYTWVTGGDDEDTDAPKLTVTETVTMPDGTTKVVEKEIVQDTPFENNCGDAKTTSSDFITLNPLDLDGTPTYPAVGLKVKAADGSGTLRSYTTDTDGTFAASSLGLDCGRGFIAYAPASINTTASGKFEFSTDSPYFDTEIEVDSIDFISVKVYDNDNNGDVYDTLDASATDYEDLDTASVTFTSTTDNATAHAMGVGGELDWTLKMKVASQKSWGDLKNYIAVDADASDYAKPTLSFDGVALKEVGKGVLDDDDAGYLSSYEYIFELPYDITETTSELRLKVNAKSSINPDVDIVVKPVAESYWIDGTTVKESIFKTDGTEVLTTARTITLDIS